MEKKKVRTLIGLLFPSSVFLPLPSPSSSFNLFSNTLAAEEVRRGGKNDRRETHSSVGWCIIDPSLTSWWKVEVCVSGVTWRATAPGWAPPIHVCDHSTSSFVYFSGYFMDRNSDFQPRWAPVSPTTSFLAILKDFSGTPKVTNEAVDCCGRLFCTRTNGCSRRSDAQGGSRAN